MQENKSIYSPEELKQLDSKLPIGWASIEWSTTTCTCVGPMNAVMTMCLSCNGAKNLASPNVFGSSWKTENVLLSPGEMRAIPVCKCDQVTFEKEKAKVTANDRQVGGNHYQKVPGEQHWDRAERLGLDFWQYMITRYVERWKDKDGIQDLDKAAHFLEKYREVVRAKKILATSKTPAKAASLSGTQAADSRDVAGTPFSESQYPQYPLKK